MSSFKDITPRHMELLAAVIQNLKTTEVDWEAVAADANFKTAKYARDEYKKAQEKLRRGAAAVKAKREAIKEGEGAASENRAGEDTVLRGKEYLNKRKAAPTEAKAKKVKKEPVLDDGEPMTRDTWFEPPVERDEYPGLEGLSKEDEIII